MKKKTNKKERLVTLRIILLVILLGAVSNQMLFGYSEAMRRDFIKGPWELVVKMGAEGSETIFPVKVENEDEPQDLDMQLPVMGTPYEITVKQYVPNLDWDNSIEKQKDGGTVVSINIEGSNLDVNMLLDSSIPEKRSITSPIGSVTIKKVHDSEKFTKMIKSLKAGKAAGLVTVWLEDGSGVDFVATVNEKLNIPGTDYTLEFLDYYPHFTIDMGTKEISNLSDSPVNPAMKVRISKGSESHEQWLWSKFADSPHMESDLPLRMEFLDFDLGGEEGNYIVAAGPDSKRWTVFVEKGKVVVEEVELDKQYEFAKEGYVFNIDNIVDEATIVTSWKNVSNELNNPALITLIKKGDEEKEAVLDLNKPFHESTEFGTLLIFYRKQMTMPSEGN